MLEYYLSYGELICRRSPSCYDSGAQYLSHLFHKLSYNLSTSPSLSLTFQQSYPAMCIYNAWRLVKLDINICN
jgi:hypothetical protein